MSLVFFLVLFYLLHFIQRNCLFTLDFFFHFLWLQRLSISQLTVQLNWVNQILRVDVGSLQRIHCILDDHFVGDISCSCVNPCKWNAGVVEECATGSERNPILVVGIDHSQCCICGGCNRVLIKINFYWNCTKLPSPIDNLNLKSPPVEEFLLCMCLLNVTVCGVVINPG